MYRIISNDGAEVAEADSFSNAIFALRTLVTEDQVDYRAVDGNDVAVAWCFVQNLPAVTVMQGGPR